MAEAKSRREAPGPRTRPRSRSEYDSANGEEDSRAGEADTPTRDGVAAPPEEPRTQEPRTQETRPQETRPQEKRHEDFGAFDDEINHRHDELKRGRTPTS